MNKKLKTRDQKRAEIVFKHIQEILDLSKTEECQGIKQKYGSLVISAPTLIRTAGLMQTLAFYEAKNDEHHKILLKNLYNELKELKIIASDAKELNNYIRSECGLIEYMRLTKEILSIFQWHRRFAQSVLKVKLGEGE